MSIQRENREHVSPKIAVVGVSALFPGSNDVRGFWQDIVEGDDQIREVPPNHWLLEDYYDPDPTAPDKTYGNTGAFLDEVPFDSMAFGIPPNIIQQTDTSQLLALIVAQKVLDDAAESSFGHVDKSRISVILGATGTTELVVHLGSRLQRPLWLKALRDNGVPEDEAQEICQSISDNYVPWTEASFPGLLGNVVAGRIANKLDLGGTNCVVDAACASSLSALSMGLSELYLKQSDMVIVGGVDTLNDILMYMCFSKTPALSATGDCRPFSDQADGTIMGEGLGMLALRRLEDAERDGDRIYAVIRGVGSSSDGKGTAVYAPKASGQANALRRAYDSAGYTPRTVELLEAHGTATKAGDLAEFQGAASVFSESDDQDTQWCGLGSVKSQIGHTKGAAGAASLIKVVMALHHKVLPPTIKVERPNPKLDVENSPFYLSTETRPWVRGSDHPRRGSVSSFGFGGSNFHVALEEYTGSSDHKDRFRPSPSELFLVSGDNADQLVDACASLTDGFVDPSSFQFLARETQLAFNGEQPFRLSVVAKDFADLQANLNAAVKAIRQEPAEPKGSPQGWTYSGVTTSDQESRLGFLFPGQGSQYVGMGSELAAGFAESQAIWDEAADLEFELGEKLHQVVFPAPVFTAEDREAQETRLRSTDWAQPAIGVTSLSQLVILNKLGIQPDCVAGHSFGEVTALHAAGSLDRKAFFSVARKRGELMAEAASMFPGAMTAVFHDAEAVADLLSEWNKGVVIANHNSPEQVVISGITTAIEAVEENLTGAGIRFSRLPVSTAFHSTVVRPAAAPFQTFLEQLAVKSPQLPVYANSTATVYSADVKALRETLSRQIARPVRFADEIEAMYEAGVRTFVEVGPGTILGNLVRKILGDRPHTAISMDRKGQHGLTSFWNGIAQLAIAGVPMQLDRLWEGINCGDDPRERTVPKLAINISGVNYNKPYPPKNGAAGLPAPNPPRQQIASHRSKTNAGGSSGAGPKQAAQPVVKTPSVVAQSSPQPVAASAVAAATPASIRPQPPEAPTAPTQPAMSATTMAPAPPIQTTTAPAIGAPIPQPLAGQSPAQPARPQPVVSHSKSESLQWVGAFQEIQRNTVDAHMAFLSVAEQSMKSLEAMLSGESSAASAAPIAQPQALTSQTPAQPAPTAAVEAPAPVAPPAPAPAPVQPLTNGIAMTPARSGQSGASAAAPAPTVKAMPAPIAPVQPAHDLHAIMLDVVTEKTGYPTEMLEMGMALDTDLGIDSIKRVEILAAMRERVPTLPEFDPNEMTALNTLGEIVDYMDAQLGGQASAAPVVAPAPVAPTQPEHDLHAIMLEVVTEKTGYPTEMLEMDMALDTDLGIDSIKRVEILAAMRERVPSLPEFDPNEMTALNTLGEIVDYMDAQLGSLPSAAPVAAPAPVAPAQPEHDLHAIMLEVVTEKTGYPTDMLEMGMALDTDLGIDSIKRVEILAAMRERVPTLPEFDPNEMTALNTLGEIVDYMDAQLGSQPLAAPVVASAPVAPAQPEHDLHAIMLEVVTEKTGYPTEMLEMGMALDTDLGIDSIKRVEILAAMRERVPTLPEFDPNEMTALNTLGEIVDYMDAQLGGQATPSAAPSASLAIDQRSGEIGRYVLKVVPKTSPGLAPPFLLDGTLVQITDDGRGVAPVLADRLNAAGVNAVVVNDVTDDARAVICLAGLRDVEAEAIEINREAFRIAAKIGADFEQEGGLFVTVQSTGGDHGLDSDIGQQAWAGGFSGLAKTAAQEWPLAVVRSLDIAANGSAEEMARRLATELLTGGADLEIGLTADGDRVSFESVASVGEGGRPVVDSQSVIVVSGGGRGVTAATAIELARQTQTRLALLGRSEIEDEPEFLADAGDDTAVKKALLLDAQARGEKVTPMGLSSTANRIQAAREIRSTLQALQDAGSEAIYLPCDVTDVDSTAAALQQVRDLWGPITGFVHGAGVLADKRLAEKTDEDFSRVFGTKVNGLRSLLAATQDDPINMICLFSSVAARTGNAGQADYAMANEVLNRVANAEVRRRNDQQDGICVVKSIGWGPWAGGMVTPVLKSKFEEMGVALIPLDAGARAFVSEVQSAALNEVETVIGGMPQEAPLIDPGQAGTPRPALFDVTVSAESHPYLRSHQFNGGVVLPLVTVQEWFLRAASAVDGQPFTGACKKLRVLKGVPLPNFEEQATRFRVQLQPDAQNPLAQNAMLFDADGVPRFAAQLVRFSAEEQFSNGTSPAASSDWQSVDWSGAELYESKLFHGPAFASISAVERIGESGTQATLTGSHSLGWSEEDLITDPAMIDGGLQLARVWGLESVRQLTLPTAIESFILHKPGLFNTAGLEDRSVRCILYGQPIGQSGTRSDIWFIDDSTGTLLAEIHGLEMYMSSETPLEPGAIVDAV